MKILDGKITRDTLKAMAQERFGEMIKAVIDLDKKIIAVDAELHADLEALLLEAGSQQKSLWGVNFYPELQGDDFIEFDSMINIRPAAGNKSRGVDDPQKRAAIIQVANQWIK